MQRLKQYPADVKRKVTATNLPANIENHTMKNAIKAKISKKPARLNQDDQTRLEPEQEMIAMYAYHIWEQEGRPDGRQEEHWLQAEAHMRYTAIE